jgi:hypothetical protein
MMGLIRPFLEGCSAGPRPGHFMTIAGKLAAFCPASSKCLAPLEDAGRCAFLLCVAAIDHDLPVASDMLEELEIHQVNQPGVIGQE